MGTRLLPGARPSCSGKTRAGRDPDHVSRPIEPPSRSLSIQRRRRLRRSPSVLWTSPCLPDEGDRHHPGPTQEVLRRRVNLPMRLGHLLGDRLGHALLPFPEPDRTPVERVERARSLEREREPLRTRPLFSEVHIGPCYPLRPLALRQDPWPMLRLFHQPRSDGVGHHVGDSCPRCPGRSPGARGCTARRPRGSPTVPARRSSPSPSGGGTP